MTRTYALKRLLEHGPMNPKQIAECTRWETSIVHSVLVQCMETETIKCRMRDGVMYYEAV